MEGDLSMALPTVLLERLVSLTSPSDACRIASLSSALRSAADSDFVWGHFLPSDYKSLLERAFDSSSVFHASSLKELYFRLCDGHILIDGGSLSFWLDRRSGKKCYMVSARSLSIIWGDTPQYWKWISIPESRFPYVAELVDVCWLVIRGKMDANLLSPDTHYAAYLVFKSEASSYGFEHDMVEVAVGVVGGEFDERSVYLDAERVRRQQYHGGVTRRRILGTNIPREEREASMPREDESKWPREREDGWVEVELGEVFIGLGLGEVEMSVMETRHLHWKSGIVIQGIEIRPKEDGI